MKTQMNLDRLNWVYTKSSLTMEQLAAQYGCSRRRISEIISKQRKTNPDKWPKRNGKPPGKQFHRKGSSYGM